jgi:MFS family permease
MLNRLLNLDAYLNNATLKHNFFVNVMDGGFFAFALSFVSVQTVLPVFVKSIGGSNIAVGLIPVVWTVGTNFPQIFIAGYVQQFSFKKRLMLRTGMMQRLPWLILALVTFFVISEVSSKTALPLFFMLFAVAAIGTSINLPVWFDLIAKITPVNVRGRLFAVRTILGAALGIIGGSVVSVVLDGITFPANYALLFLCAFIAMMISYGFLVAIREEFGNMAKVPIRYKEYLLHIPAIFRQRKNYRNFVIADALFFTSSTANAFYAVYAFDKFALSDAYAGTFTIVMMVSMILGSLTLGYIADNFGHRINLILASAGTTCASILALVAGRVEIYAIVFMISAITISILMISRLSFIAELCTDDERPTFVALSNMLITPFVLSGILAGWIADIHGYDVVFIATACISLCGVIWLIKMVHEPRFNQNNAQTGN